MTTNPLSDSNQSEDTTSIRTYGIEPNDPTDNITKLQKQLNVISSIMVDSTAKHVEAPPVPIFSNAPKNEEYEKKMNEVREQAKRLGKEFVKACIDFERMLDDIPGVNSTEEDQIEQLVKLNAENEIEAQVLLKSVSLAGKGIHFCLLIVLDDLLTSVSDALKEQFFDIVQKN
jgi:hypothetical protein